MHGCVTQSNSDNSLSYWHNRNYAWHAFVLPVKLVSDFGFTGDSFGLVGEI